MDGEGYNLESVTTVDTSILGVAQKQNWQESMELQQQAEGMGKEVVVGDPEDDDGQVQDKGHLA